MINEFEYRSLYLKAAKYLEKSIGKLSEMLKNDSKNALGINALGQQEESLRKLGEHE